MTKQKTDIREVLNEQVPEERDELYNDYVDGKYAETQLVCQSV